jgi:hypothetical protein
MTSVNDQLLAEISKPANLPTAYAMCDWLNGDSVAPNVPLEARLLLQEEGSLRRAITIREAISTIETNVFSSFWANVQAWVNRKLSEFGIDGWHVLMSAPEDKYSGFISITTGSEDCDQNILFQVCAQNLRVPVGEERCFFGVWKGEKNEEDLELAMQLKRDGFRSNKYWAGFKWMHSCGLPDFTMTRSNVIRLNADNHSNDKPLANDVGERLWQLFASHRVRLAELNRTRLG